jgi:hypothetical protein
MTDHDLEATTQAAMPLCTCIVFESNMLRPLNPELLREKRHSPTMWSSDPMMMFSESVKVARMHTIPSTSWAVGANYDGKED